MTSFTAHQSKRNLGEFKSGNMIFQKAKLGIIKALRNEILATCQPGKNTCRSDTYLKSHEFRNKNHFKRSDEVVLICEYVDSEIRIASTFSFVARLTVCQAVRI